LPLGLRTASPPTVFFYPVSVALNNIFSLYPEVLSVLHHHGGLMLEFYRLLLVSADPLQVLERDHIIDTLTGAHASTSATSGEERERGLPGISLIIETLAYFRVPCRTPFTWAKGETYLVP